MKKRLMALLAAFCMTVSMIGSGTVVSAAEQKTKDEVIVTMPATSEPEAGFDPAYGWGAGEHVHEPLIQSSWAFSIEPNWAMIFVAVFSPTPGIPGILSEESPISAFSSMI